MCLIRAVKTHIIFQHFLNLRLSTLTAPRFFFCIAIAAPLHARCGDALKDANDPGCHTDGNASNTLSYDPTDDNELDGAGSTQCSDLRDNDRDGLRDTYDPGCHTDFNASNAVSYDPTDDDETNKRKPIFREF